jgi:uncharacterized membrane protein
MKTDLGFGIEIEMHFALVFGFCVIRLHQITRKGQVGFRL